MSTGFEKSVEIVVEHLKETNMNIGASVVLEMQKRIEKLEAALKKYTRRPTQSGNGMELGIDINSKQLWEIAEKALEYK